MPFKSKSQQRFLFATKPSIAKEFAKETKNMKKLPEKADNEAVAASSAANGALFKEDIPKRKGQPEMQEVWKNAKSHLNRQEKV